ncbi:MAG: zf-HC2 domain-containing protein [Ignavibacteriae bacterium]|nr:zf-HC2 domain-containing protein [Ignavibacteriota bacterium]
MSSEHVRDELLQMYVDSRLDATESAAVRQHLLTCRVCSSAHFSLTQLDRGLRSLPTERLASDFSSRVMTKLSIAPRSPFLFKAIENMAYVFGLMIVLGIMLTAFVLTGAVSMEQFAESRTVVNSFTDSMSLHLRSAIDALTLTLETYLPFVFRHSSMKVAAMATVVIGMLALIDRIVRRRVL